MDEYTVLITLGINVDAMSEKEAIERVKKMIDEEGIEWEYNLMEAKAAKL